VPEILGWAVIYLIVAALVGWWPFSDPIFKTISGECNYDNGYEDGYDGALAACSSNDYQVGYEDGVFEGECAWLKCEKKDYVGFTSYGCGSWDQRQCP